jgi:hypothetical protein
MTTAEINRRFQRFVIATTSDGFTSRFEVKMAINFNEVKKIAVNHLKGVLDRAHGRGDHTVRIYGLDFVDTATEEQQRNGLSLMDWVEYPEALFVL